jgi:hypothetical protein
LGKQLNASYVVAGYIAKLGNRNLVIVSILEMRTLQMVAGDYLPYTKIEEVNAVLPSMAEKLAISAGRDTSKLPGLSVPPFEISKDVNEGDAQTLAQILSINVANGNRYAVLPRADSADKVLEDRRERIGRG